MKIPEKLEVAGIVYDVSTVSQNDADLNRGSNAASQYMPFQFIKLSDKYEEGDYKNQSFTHEFTHAILDALDVSHQTIEIDERFVESFSQLLYQILKQL